MSLISISSEKSLYQLMSDLVDSVVFKGTRLMIVPIRWKAKHGLLLRISQFSSNS